MQYLQKISEKIGFTQTELKVNAFLFLVLIIGIIIKLVGWQNNNSTNSGFDYTATDSIFYSTDNYKSSLSDNDITESNLQKSISTASDLKINTKKPELREKSINLNTANLEQLTMLPGIGVKTAQSILAYRKASSGFSKIEEVMEVKNIGESKFDKIKKYIYVGR